MNRWDGETRNAGESQEAHITVVATDGVSATDLEGGR